MYKIFDMGLFCFDEFWQVSVTYLIRIVNYSFQTWTFYGKTKASTFMTIKNANDFFLFLLSCNGFMGTLNLILKCFLFHLLTTYILTFT